MILTGQPSDKTNDFITSLLLGQVRQADLKRLAEVRLMWGVSAETSCARFHKPLPRKRDDTYRIQGDPPLYSWNASGDNP